jgi:hypothetical protein
MKTTLLIISFIFSFSNIFSQDITTSNKISKFIDQWHKDAAEANGEEYFSFMDEESIYIGTDKEENWTKEQFQSFAKPYFDSGKAWDFKTISRNIYFSNDNKVAWFDELLDTWMGVCRGSGVLEFIDGEWKLKHYHLSVTVSNEKIQDFIKLSE